MPVRTRLLVCTLLAVLAISFGAGPAAAQRYDKDCKEVEVPPDDIDVRKEILEGYLPTGLGFIIADKTCQVVNYFKKVFSTKKDPSELGPNEVFEALKPEPPKRPAPPLGRNVVPGERTLTPLARSPGAGGSSFDNRVAAVDQKYGYSSWSGQPRTWGPDTNAYEQGAFEANIAMEEAKLTGQPDYTMMPPDRKGGFIKIFEARGGPPETADGKELKPGDIDGAGVLLSEEGIERGNFTDGELNGRGEEITDDGVWRGGSFQQGQLDGAGFEVAERNGEYYVLEGDFVDDMPDGMVTMTYGDGSSQRNMWVDGRVAARGTRVAAGQIPEDAPYKSPAQLAAEAEAAFDASLAEAPNAGVLFALADELAEKGDSARARRALRALIAHFPDSPLAERAADQLTGGGAGQPVSQGLSGVRSTPVSSPAVAPSAPAARYSSVCERDGQKINDIELGFGGSQPSRDLYLAYVKLLGRCASYDSGVKTMYDQYVGLSNSTPSGPLPPNADRSIAEVNKALANPNYSVELGPYRLGPGGTGGGGSTSQAGGRCAAGGDGLALFDKAFADLMARYPLPPGAGTRDTYQYKMFFGTEGLQLLAQYKDCMAPGTYETNRAALQGQLDDGKTNCPKFSTDGGANCVAEYPRNWR